MASQPTENQTADRALADQILADRFEVIAEPLGWRCRGCRATVSADHDRQAASPQAEAMRLAEAAADHALYCGRCED